MQAGSITFSTALDNEQLEKDLQSLTKKIEKKEREIAELTAKRDQAKDQSLFDSDTLDREKAKLQEIKDQLTDLRNMSKDKAYSLETREGYAAQIPALKQEYEDQRTRVNALQREWNKVESSVDKYTAQLSEAEAELQRQKEEAGYITQKLEEASRGEGKVVAFLSRVDEKLSSVIDKLRQQQAVSAEVNKALGDVVSTQTKLTGLAEEFSLGAKIGLAGLAQTAIQMTSSIAKGVPNVLKAASSRVAGFAKNTLGKIPSLAKAAFSKASQFASKFGKELFGIVKNMNVFSKLSVSLGRTFKRLGSTIKQAFVFSVIYQGLSLIRQQMGSYLMVNAKFSTALRQLQGVLLTAFQPIYDAVVPALTTLMNILSRVIATITQFTAALFGTTAKQAQKNAEALHKEANALKETGSAAEDAAGSLAGFDEINTIQTEQQGGGGGGASQEVGPSFDYEYAETAFDSWGEAFDAFLDNLINNGIPRLESAFSSFADWLNDLSKKLYDMFTFPGVLEKVQQLGRDLANAFNDLVNSINWYQLGQALGAGLNLALQFLVNFLYTFDWMNLGKSLAAMINGAVSEIDWYAVGMLLWAGFKIAIETLAGLLLGLDMPLMAEAASNLVIGFFDSMKETIQIIPWNQIGLQIATFLANLDWAGMFNSVYAAFSTALDALSKFIIGFLDGIGEQFDMHEITDPMIELVQTVHDFIQTIVEDTINWVSSLDLEPLATAFQNLLEAISPLVSTVSDGLLWAYENVLLPLATWFIEEGAPASVEALSDAFNLITEILEPLIDIFKLLWEQVIQPFVEWVEGTAVTVIEGLGSVFEKVADIFQTKGEQIQNIISFVMEIIAAMWEQSQPILEGMQDLVGNVFEFIGDIISTVVSSAIDILSGLIDFIEGVFSGDWEKAWDGISSVFKGIWNGIVGTLESAINFVIRGINSLIAQLNKVSFDVPDWVPSIGGKTFGFNVPSISEVQIPRLAQGAVIPPNREFMAVLGDQRSGTNIEAPLETIKQALAEVMQSQAGGEIVVNITTTLDGRVLARNQVRHINDMTRQAGKPVLLF